MTSLLATPPIASPSLGRHRGFAAAVGILLAAPVWLSGWAASMPLPILGKISLPLNSMRRLIFIVPAKAVPPIALRRMLEANLVIAKALNVPLLVRADKSYVQTFEALFAAIKTKQDCKLEVIENQLEPEKLAHEAVSDFLVLPGFGSRKRVQDTLGNIPEQIARFFDGNLAILHFDK